MATKSALQFRFAQSGDHWTGARPMSSPETEKGRSRKARPLVLLIVRSGG